MVKANNVYGLVAQTGVVALQVGILFSNSNAANTLLSSEVRSGLMWMGTSFAVIYALIWCYVTPKVFNLTPSQNRDYWLFGSVAGTGLAFASLIGGVFLIAHEGFMPS